jgi:hypothetical protein
MIYARALPHCRAPLALALLLAAPLGCYTGGTADGTDTDTGAGTTQGPGATGGSTSDDPSSPGSTAAVDDSGTTSALPGDSTLAADSSESSSTGVEIPTEPFSFFVTSLRAMQELSGSEDGFGGDLSFGEVGPGAGLRGADAICAAIAEQSMPGAAAKQWRAFLSAAADENGQPVHAIDRIGEGPWYDRLGRVVAMTKEELQAERPLAADPAIIDDLPNEDGVPNHQPDATQPEVDNHDTLTGSDGMGYLFDANATCSDWTSSEGQEGVRPRIGHSWPRGADNGRHYISDHDAGGCAPGVNIVGGGGPQPGDFSVGAGGGYGGIYCFALYP